MDLRPVILFLSCVFLACADAVLAQQPDAGGGAPSEYHVQEWQVEQGLSRLSISALAQAPKGYLWLGTHYGVIRFDGVSFTRYEAEVVPAFSQGAVRQILCDRFGRIWIACAGGLVCYENGEFQTAVDLVGAPIPAVDSIAEISPGEIAAVIYDGRIYRMSGEDVAVTRELVPENRNRYLFQLAHTVEDMTWFSKAEVFGQLANGGATNVASSALGPVRLCARKKGGVWWVSGQELRHIPAGSIQSIKEPVNLGFETVTLCEDRNGVLWMGTRREGIWAYRDGTLKQVWDAPRKVDVIFEDEELNIWAGTDGGGLLQIRPRLFDIWTAEQGLPDNHVVSVCANEAGVAFAAPAGAGLARIGLNGRLNTIEGFQKINLVTLLPAASNAVWAGSAGSGLYHWKRGQVQRFMPVLRSINSQIRVLFRDSRNRIWIGGFPHGLYSFNENTPQKYTDYSNLGFRPNRPVTAITEDSQGVLWLGTGDGELFQWEGTTFKRAGSNAILSRAIGALHFSRDGTLWIGTLGAGLGRYSKGKFDFIDEAHGLHDDVITRIESDNSGFLWMGSSSGLFRVRESEVNDMIEGRRANVDSIVYGSSDGVGNLECAAGHQPSVWKTPKGEIWFATSKGIVKVNPESMPINERPPPLVIEGLRLDGRIMTNNGKILLGPFFRKLEFSYTALSFAAPEKVRFRTRLVGFDSDWVEGGARTVTFPRLGPGEYRFEVTACNNDGVWNGSPIGVSFNVAPALWQTWWFRGGALVLFAAGVAGVARWISTVRMRRQLQRIEQERVVDRERARIARDLHDDLGARLTRMSLIGGLAAGVDEFPRKGPEALRQVASEARAATRALDEVVWMINPSKDSLAHTIEYISQYANGFFRGSGIDCRQDIPAEMPQQPLPAEHRHHLFLAVKEALNNVQKHSGATEVWIRIRIGGGCLEVTVEDNGKGMAHPAASRNSGNGLLNMQQRLTGVGGEFRLENGARGARVVFRVPLSHEEEK